MADQHDGVVGMTAKDKPQRIGGACHEVLQRFAIRKADEMRRGEPRGEQCWILAFGLLKSLQLPGAVVDVCEVVANFRRRAAGLGYGGAGFDATAHRTRIDPARLPGAGNAARDGLCLGAPELGQIERRPTAKSLGLDAFDVAVTDQQDFGHAARLTDALGRRRTLCSPRLCYGESAACRRTPQCLAFARCGAAASTRRAKWRPW